MGINKSKPAKPSYVKTRRWKKYIRPIVVAKRGVFRGPCDVAVCPVTNNICICDGPKRYVKIYTKDFLEVYSITGTTQEGNMKFPGRVTVNTKGQIIISDYLANVVSVHGGDGRYLRQLPGPWNKPYGVATDSADKVYVCDGGSFSIHVHDSSGNRMFTFGSQGSGQGQFARSPRIIAVSEETLFVSDGSVLEEFTTSGSYVSTLNITELISVGGLAVTNKRDLVVSDSIGRIVYVISKGKVRYYMGTNPYGQLTDPLGVAVTATGAIIVANWGDYEVLMYEPKMWRTVTVCLCI